jgi:hypothetical protein
MVPVPWAAAESGIRLRARREAARKTPRNEANKGCGIPDVLIGEWLGVPPRRGRRRTPVAALESGTGWRSTRVYGKAERRGRREDRKWGSGEAEKAGGD